MATHELCQDTKSGSAGIAIIKNKSRGGPVGQPAPFTLQTLLPATDPDLPNNVCVGRWKVFVCVYVCVQAVVLNALWPLTRPPPPASA